MLKNKKCFFGHFKHSSFQDQWLEYIQKEAYFANV